MRGDARWLGRPDRDCGWDTRRQGPGALCRAAQGGMTCWPRSGWCPEMGSARLEAEGERTSRPSYRALRAAAEPLDAWPLEQEAAQVTLQRADARGFVDALLSDDEVERAWTAAAAAPDDALGSDLWLRLAERRERDRPADALVVYQRIADEVLEQADRRAYRSATRILQRARAAAQAAGELDAFAEYLTGLRERYRRRPTLMEILDKAGL